jgi:hypothetical protein
MERGKDFREAIAERGGKGRGRGQTMISDRGSEQHAGAEKVNAV